MINVEISFGYSIYHLTLSENYISNSITAYSFLWNLRCQITYLLNPLSFSWSFFSLISLVEFYPHFISPDFFSLLYGWHVFLLLGEVCVPSNLLFGFEPFILFFKNYAPHDITIYSIPPYNLRSLIFIKKTILILIINWFIMKFLLKHSLGRIILIIILVRIFLVGNFIYLLTTMLNSYYYFLKSFSFFF